LAHREGEGKGWARPIGHRPIGCRTLWERKQRNPHTPPPGKTKPNAVISLSKKETNNKGRIDETFVAGPSLRWKVCFSSKGTGKETRLLYPEKKGGSSEEKKAWKKKVAFADLGEHLDVGPLPQKGRDRRRGVRLEGFWRRNSR